MLKSKKFNIILALIIAIALWAYVLGEVNPGSTTTVKNVPINFTNQESLEDNGLTVLGSSQTSISVSISGQRTAITKVEPGDFSVTCDVEGLNKGSHTVRINVTGPDNVKIDHISVEKINVDIDDLTTEEKTVEVAVNGQAGTDKEADIVETNLETVRVTGAKTLVDKVDKVKASVELSKIGTELSTFNTELTPVDKSGVQVLNVRLSSSEVKVTAVMLSKKTVSLEVPVTGTDYGDIERSVSVPKTVTIKGTEDDIKDISKITCRTLDVSGVYTNDTLPLEPILPDGIQLSDDSDGLSAKVTVKDLSKKSFEFDQDDIDLLNRQDGFTYTISAVTFSAELTGRESVMSGLTADDVTISADVSGLGRGTHTVTLTVTCGKDTSSATLSVERVEITVE